jgi:uncharacterized protein YjbI with pentapeptide repeats
MLIICEPRFYYKNEDNQNMFLQINVLDNEAFLRSEIVRILTDLFPDKIGDIEKIGNSVYGVSVFDSDDTDEEMYTLSEYNAQKNRIDIQFERVIYNAFIELCTFMNRHPYPEEMVFSEQQIMNLQDLGVQLSGLKSLNSINLTSADLSGFNFNGSDPINECIFDDTILIASQFTDTIINNTSFIQADMRNAAFNVSTLTNVNFSKADLRYANFHGATLINVDLTDADLRYADLNDVTFDKNCNLDGAQFVNLENIIERIYEYPQNLFDNVINTQEEFENENDEEGYEAIDETAFLKANESIFSSAHVNAGDETEEAEEADDDDDDEYRNNNNKPPICADVINGYDINIQAFLDKNNANFSIQLPNSNNYECVNLNDIKKFHIKTDKAGTKYFNYTYACNSDNSYYEFTEDNYVRAQPYIRMGTFSLLVEKPEWFPQAEFPIYRNFKLVKVGSKPAFVSETMLRHGEQGDEDYISSEWHCNTGKMDTYKLEPVMEGGERKKKKKTHKKELTHKKKITHKKQKHKNKKTYKKNSAHKKNKKNKKNNKKKENKKTHKL